MSRVVVMDLRRHNTVLVGHERYFIFAADGRPLLVRDWCPHRGGPLSLSRQTADGRRLVCPWHGTKVGTAAVKRTSVPMVRSGDEAVVLLADTEADAPVTVIHKRILANLPPEAESTETPACLPDREPAGAHE